MKREREKALKLTPSQSPATLGKVQDQVCELKEGEEVVEARNLEERREVGSHLEMLRDRKVSGW